MLIKNIAWSDIIRVPGDYSTIQAGIDAAVDGDTVLVANGTYKGTGNKNLDFGGKAIIVTSENGAESCTIDCENDGRGFYFHSGESESSVVSGFTITNGFTEYGGGIRCENSSSPTIEKNIIEGNSASIHGGGIFCLQSSPTIQNNEISGNSASSCGGGISCDSNPSGPFQTIQNNKINGNSATYGGGIYWGDNPSPFQTMQNNEISGNSALHSGGGIFCSHSSPTIRNNMISGNSTNFNGGGLYCEDASPTIQNNVISGNSSDENEGGIYCRDSSPQIINNTISGNSAEYGGGITSVFSLSNPTVLNTILWSNSPNEIRLSDSAKITITYSDIQGGWPGEGNINSDPQFGNPYSGYAYDLKPGSPCINKGTSSGAPSTDIVGRSRPSGSGVDMGAYEQNDDGTLAVELSSFTASITNDGVIIRWRTESETNNVGFSIYRSESKKSDYAKITFVSGAGNTGMPTDYQFNDTKVEPGKTYFYYLEDVDIAGERNKSDIIKVVVPPAQPIPEAFQLLQNYPNPFNPETWIPFKLAQDTLVTISIYDVKGQLVRTIALGNRTAGIYTTKSNAAYWDGRDSLGQKVSSGVYYYTLQAGEFKATRKMVIMK